ncbi:MAG: ribosome biogenesis GTP-binding protein YihA/YsxC [Gemmatimonadetes bacterium]|nr:ribosome biogenesis GTP-binding protein YihA/YsxC [Gemmatimonadota bacterium]
MEDATPATPDTPATPALPTKDPMVIRHLEFLGPMAQDGGWRPTPGLPEVAFAGRSNVGKSSLLNKLVRRKAFARVSNTPGRTREINFFAVNKTFTFVDLPGYGYARISKGRREEWKPLIEGYLRTSAELRGIVQLLDVRHDPTVEDVAMFDLLADLGIPTIVVATKIDKLKPRELKDRMHAIAVLLELEEDQMIAFSAVSGVGRDTLAEAIVELLSHPSWRAP